MSDRILAGGLLAAGLVIAACLLAPALGKIGQSDRYVEVKGLAEREVPANLAIWPLVYSATGNDLPQVQSLLERDADRILAFLADQGFDAEDITRSAPRITDKLSQQYGNGGAIRGSRYTAEATVLLRTSQLAALRQAQQQAGELVRAGVVLMHQWGAQTQFLFTELNAIKPDMIAEATRNGRQAAARFAEDSGAQVGRLLRARQGLFTITDRDPHSPEIKHIRVVSTLEYQLIDD